MTAKCVNTDRRVVKRTYMVIANSKQRYAIGVALSVATLIMQPGQFWVSSGKDWNGTSWIYNGKNVAIIHYQSARTGYSYPNSEVCTSAYLAVCICMMYDVCI